MMVENLLGKVAEGGEYENTHRKEEHKKTQLLQFEDYSAIYSVK